MKNRLENIPSQPSTSPSCTPPEIHRVAMRINQVRTQLSKETGERTLYSDAIKELGLGDLLQEKYLLLWKEVLAVCLNLEVQARFSQLQKDLGKEDAPFSSIVLDATCTHSGTLFD